jgi:DNA-binding IclR family transcriptional regulator
MAESASPKTNRSSGPGRGWKGTTVPAAARAMALFEVFAAQKHELTKSEVARLLELPESSTSDLLSTLHSIGYLSRTATTRRYYPTGRMMAIADQIAAINPLQAFGAEACAVLSQKTGETSALTTRVGNAIEIHAVAPGLHRLRYVVSVGDSFSIHGTAQGKALLSEMDDEERSRLLRIERLPKLTPNTIVDPRELEEHILESRERGWFHSRDEGTVGVSSFAVVRTFGLEAVSLGVIGPTERIVAESERLVPELLAAAETVFDS